MKSFLTYAKWAIVVAALLCAVFNLFYSPWLFTAILGSKIFAALPAAIFGVVLWVAVNAYCLKNIFGLFKKSIDRPSEGK